MAATIVHEHLITIDNKEFAVFAEVRNGAPAERWRIAIIVGGDWKVCSSSHVSRKEAFDALYLLALHVTATASRTLSQ